MSETNQNQESSEISTPPRRRVVSKWIVAGVCLVLLGDASYLVWSFQNEELIPNPAVIPFDLDHAVAHQVSWAKHLGTPVEFENSLGMRFAIIPPGHFQMGSRAEEKAHKHREGPRHAVTLSNAYYAGLNEVTLGDFRQFVKVTGYQIAPDRDAAGTNATSLRLGNWIENEVSPWETVGFEQNEHHPVVNITWYDAMAFCRWLSEIEDRTYRLPTEAEWEFACRAGTDTIFNSGNSLWFWEPVENQADQALRPGLVGHKEDATPWNDGYAFTAPVKSYRPNAFGLFDTHGNVREWTLDWYDEEYYKNSPSTDPLGPEQGQTRTLRGGSWGSNEYYCRTGRRTARSPGSRNVRNGFRIVCELPENSDFGKFDASRSWESEQFQGNVRFDEDVE